MSQKERPKMVKTTFLNLPESKRQRVTAALLHEFSNYALTEAQVARIVTDAGIARGAFYKYFDNLTDAYLYLYKIAIKEIHMNIKPIQKFDPEFFYIQVAKFIDQTQQSKYAPLIKLHMLRNKAVVSANMKKSSSQLSMLSPEIWMAMVLSHETINSILVTPDSRQTNLKRFKDSLYLIFRGLSE